MRAGSREAVEDDAGAFYTHRMVEAESISRITQFSDFQTFEFHEPVKWLF